MQVSIYLFYLITLWPVVLSSLFSSWIASTIFLPMGFLIYNLRSKNESEFFPIIIVFLLNFIFYYSHEKIASFLNIYDYPDEIRKKHPNPFRF